MPTKIGHFEILSELAKSPTGAVYKVNDPESGQTVALKAIQLNAFGEHAKAVEQALLQEAESTKALSSPNITPIFGAGEIEGQFCAAMEYVQGNSIATMLARKEGFSIWDLLDIGRQLCTGFDQASSQGIVHYSLEPSKIMCGWDGTVRILSFGVSSVGKFAQYVTEGVPSLQHYMSPEQVAGKDTDGRSNLFSLGAMLYEMVTERKAFDREDIQNLRQSILDSTPVAPAHVSPKIHPLLSDLIMKALAKDPAQRYQTGRELLDDLEKCKESKPAAKPAAKGAAGPAKAVPPSKPAPATPKAPTMAPAAMAKAAAASAQSGSVRPSSLAAPGSTSAAKPSPPPPKKSEQPAAQSQASASKLAQPKSGLAMPQTMAAAAGAGSDTEAASEIPEIDLSNQFITSCVKATIAASEAPSASMSAAVEEPQVEPAQVETFEPEAASAPRIAVDPMMAEGGQTASKGTSFSEISELPPLKEIYVAPPPPPPVFEPTPPAKHSSTMFQGTVKRDEKPKVQPKEVAEKAIQEIKSVPPSLYAYAIGGALALILAIGIGVTVYVHSQNSDDDSGAGRPAATVNSAPEVSQPAPSAVPPPAAAQPTETPAPEAAAATPAPSPKARTHRKASPPPAPVIIPGQLAVDSTPAGAQVQLDGKTDPSWVTPLSLTSLQPGQHAITVTKPGYTPDSRTVNVASGNRATVVVHLAQLMATLVVNSDPPGANIYIDGRDMGAKTPGQVSVDKGQHVVLVRKMGYVDETVSQQFVLGQTFNFSPTLRALGNVDDIRTVGKMSKLFGGKGAQAGQATVSVHTQPKGAQVAINQRVLDKNSPVDVALDPGNYVIDITLTGYAPVHRVVSADKGGKVVVDEVLQKQ
jgi:eukaryotic-like serine/threonine-protein kinase